MSAKSPMRSGGGGGEDELVRYAACPGALVGVGSVARGASRFADHEGVIARCEKKGGGDQGLEREHDALPPDTSTARPHDIAVLSVTK